MEPLGAGAFDGEGGFACRSGNLGLLRLTVGNRGTHDFHVSEGCRSCPSVLRLAHIADAGIHSLFPEVVCSPCFWCCLLSLSYRARRIIFELRPNLLLRCTVVYDPRSIRYRVFRTRISCASCIQLPSVSLRWAASGSRPSTPWSRGWWHIILHLATP